ncbi:MAG TPA: thioredoxin domain-containing protein, partial [Gammaproteobacteria bacterium]|nr:thioredoxin domain-containing protein [Gammaproteobacteria bacterium]
SHAGMLLALQDALDPPTLVVLRCRETALMDWQAELAGNYDPRRLVLSIPTDAAGLGGLLARCLPRGEACAYICHGARCSLPVTSLASLVRALETSSAGTEPA